MTKAEEDESVRDEGGDEVGDVVLVGGTPAVCVCVDFVLLCLLIDGSSEDMRAAIVIFPIHVQVDTNDFHPQAVALFSHELRSMSGVLWGINST